MSSGGSNFPGVLAVLAVLACSPMASAANYHVVGWANTFVPGGGQFLLGDPLRGSTQAVIEGGTFGYGYSLSKRAPMTLDGVPEDLQIETGALTKRRIRVCTKWETVNGKLTCTQFQSVLGNVVVPSTEKVDETRAGLADLLQEARLEYH